jgi:predicted DNA-binding transcriptional regulator AlpA
MIATSHNKLIDSQEVMQRIGVSYTTLWRLVKTKKIPSPRKIGKLNRWLEADIERYIAPATNETTTSSTPDA